MSDSDLRARMRAFVQTKPAPTRTAGRRRAIALHAIAIAVMLAIFEGAGGAAHGAGRPILPTILVLGAVSIVAAVASVLASSPRGSMLARPWWVQLALVLAAPFLVTVAMTAWHYLYDEPSNRFGWRCLGLTIAMGCALGAAMFAVRRARVIHHPALTGSALGVTAGIWATLLVDVWCPLTNLQHVLVGHAAPVVVLGILGAIVGAPILRMKSK